MFNGKTSLGGNCPSWQLSGYRKLIEAGADPDGSDRPP